MSDMKDVQSTTRKSSALHTFEWDTVFCPFSSTLTPYITSDFAQALFHTLKPKPFTQWYINSYNFLVGSSELIAYRLDDRPRMPLNPMDHRICETMDIATVQIRIGHDPNRAYVVLPSPSAFFASQNIHEAEFRTRGVYHPPGSPKMNVDWETTKEGQPLTPKVPDYVQWAIKLLRWHSERRCLP